MSKVNKNQEFTLVEHFGTEQLQDIILEPLINFINERANRIIVKVRERDELPILTHQIPNIDKGRRYRK